MNKIVTTVAALLASVAFAGSANAATYVLTYTSAGVPAAASITITTADTLNAVGGYDILSASGTVGADVLTGLIPNPNQPNTVTSADGLFFYDNVFFAGTPALGTPGLYVASAAFQYNLFFRNGSYELYQAAGGAFTANSAGTLTVTSVPESATWAMMLAGFGMVGFGMRYRRSKAPTIAYA